jgi:hypothetical protein
LRHEKKKWKSKNTIKPKEKQQTQQNMPSIKRELSASQEKINNSSLRQFCSFSAIYRDLSFIDFFFLHMAEVLKIFKVCLSIIL